MRICVYCSSSDAVDSVYVEAAHALGHEIATRGHELVYGGASVGLMGDVARAATAAGGRVLGIIPQRFVQRNLAYQDATDIIVTETMAQRKARMIEVAEAFVALPGGFGTLEEVSEVLTLMQLGDLNRALVLMNTEGFYEDLLALFERFFAGSFARREYRRLYHVASDACDALDHIEHYHPFEVPDKWF